MHPSHFHTGRFARLGLAVCVFAGGLLASGVFSSAVPAAPQDCVPVVGCVTTPLPTVTVPTLPTLPVTTLPVTTAEPDAGTTATPTTAPSGGTKSPESKPEAALTAKASIRVRGHGANRLVEIRVSLSKAARVSALLTRTGRALARRQFAGRAGSSILRLRVGRAPKPGAARLALTFRSDSGETTKANYRLRLPR